jgi:hypothetical protein
MPSLCVSHNKLATVVLQPERTSESPDGLVVHRPLVPHRVWLSCFPHRQGLLTIQPWCKSAIPHRKFSSCTHSKHRAKHTVDSQPAQNLGIGKMTNLDRASKTKSWQSCRHCVLLELRRTLEYKSVYYRDPSPTFLELPGECPNQESQDFKTGAPQNHSNSQVLLYTLWICFHPNGVATIITSVLQMEKLRHEEIKFSG